jgi:hypothetical protein
MLAYHYYKHSLKYFAIISSLTIIMGYSATPKTNLSCLGAIKDFSMTQEYQKPILELLFSDLDYINKNRISIKSGNPSTYNLINSVKNHSPALSERIKTFFDNNGSIVLSYAGHLPPLSFIPDNKTIFLNLTKSEEATLLMLEHELVHFETQQKLLAGEVEKLKGLDGVKEDPLSEFDSKIREDFRTAWDEPLFIYFEELKATTAELKRMGDNHKKDRLSTAEALKGKSKRSLTKQEITSLEKDTAAALAELSQPSTRIADISAKALYPFQAAINTSLNLNQSLVDLRHLDPSMVKRDLENIITLKKNIQDLSPRKLSEAEILAHPHFIGQLNEIKLLRIYNEEDIYIGDTIALMFSGIKKTETFYKFMLKKDPSMNKSLREYIEENLIIPLEGTPQYAHTRVIFNEVFQHLYP